MNKKLLSLLVALVAMFWCLGSMQAQNWTWTGETPSSGNSYYILSTYNYKFLMNDNNANNDGLGETFPTKWNFTQSGDTWTMKDTESAPHYLFVHRTGSATSLKAGNFEVQTNKTNPSNDDDNSSNFWLKSTGNGYTMNVYIRYYKALIGSNDRKGDVYVGIKENGTAFSPESSVNNRCYWRYIAESELTLYRNYVTAYKALDACKGEKTIPLDLKNRISQALSNNNSASSSDAETKTSALNALVTEYNNYIASLSAATKESGKDVTGIIINPGAETNNTTGWTTDAGVLSNGHAHSGTYQFETAGWGKNKGSMTQTISNLPNGYYKVSVWYIAATETDMKLTANDVSTTPVRGIGDSQYNQLTTDFVSVKDGTITITATSSTTAGENWSNFDDFSLTYYGPIVKSIYTEDDVTIAEGEGFNNETDKIVIESNITTVDLRGATGSIDVDVTANPNALIYTKGITVNKTDNVVVNGSCDNLVLVDGYPFRAAWQFEADNAKYTMTAVASNSNVSFGTIMIPFAATSMPDGVKIYVLDKELNFGNEIQATSTTSVNANTPLLVTKSGDYSAKVVSVAVTQNTYTNGKLTGTYSKIDAAEKGSYVLQKHDDRVAFFLVGNASQTPTKPSVNPFRAYVTVSQANGAKARFISVMFDDESTGILQIAEDGTTNVGRGQIYDLMGRKVVNPSNGIYVVNGKKVFIK